MIGRRICYISNSTREGHWEMLACTTGRTRSGRYLLPSSLVVMTGVLTMAAQSAEPSHTASVTRPSNASKMCSAQKSHPSEKVAALLESIQDHPTAGAYNTLGVLYAHEDRISCAIAAFETSLKLENQNWEAHYNLALALLREGDRSRAMRELRT